MDELIGLAAEDFADVEFESDNDEPTSKISQPPSTQNQRRHMQWQPPRQIDSSDPILQLASSLRRPKRLFGYKWSEGYVAPFVGAQHGAINLALGSLSLKVDDFVLDLGCGDGRNVISAARWVQ